jgi:ribosome-binding factor A
MIKNSNNLNIHSDILNKKSDLGKRRVSKVASSIKRIVAEVVHGEFAQTCSDFSVIEGSMSPDLKYADIFITFYEITDKKLQEAFLVDLNYDVYQKYESKFAKISLKKAIAQSIAQKMRLKYMPQVRFKIADEAMIYVC